MDEMTAVVASALASVARQQSVGMHRRTRIDADEFKPSAISILRFLHAYGWVLMKRSDADR